MEGFVGLKQNDELKKQNEKYVFREISSNSRRRILYCIHVCAGTLDVFSGLVRNSIKITLSTTTLPPFSILEEATGRSLPAQKTVVI